MCEKGQVMYGEDSKGTFNVCFAGQQAYKIGSKKTAKTYKCEAEDGKEYDTKYGSAVYNAETQARILKNQHTHCKGALSVFFLVSEAVCSSKTRTRKSICKTLKTAPLCRSCLFSLIFLLASPQPVQKCSQRSRKVVLAYNCC